MTCVNSSQVYRVLVVFIMSLVPPQWWREYHSMANWNLICLIFYPRQTQDSYEQMQNICYDLLECDVMFVIQVWWVIQTSRGVRMVYSEQLQNHVSQFVDSVFRRFIFTAHVPCSHTLPGAQYFYYVFPSTVPYIATNANCLALTFFPTTVQCHLQKWD